MRVGIVVLSPLLALSAFLWRHTSELSRSYSRIRSITNSRNSVSPFDSCRFAFPPIPRIRAMAHSLGAALPYDVVSVIRSHLPYAEFDSVKSKQIALFYFAAVSSLHRQVGLECGEYLVVGADEIISFLALLEGNPKMATGMKRLDLHCPTGQFQHMDTDRRNDPAWQGTANILFLSRNLQSLEIRLGKQGMGSYEGVQLWKNYVIVCNQLERLTKLREFCYDEGWNAFDYKAVE